MHKNHRLVICNILKFTYLASLGGFFKGFEHLTWSLRYILRTLKQSSKKTPRFAPLRHSDFTTSQSKAKMQLLHRTDFLLAILSKIQNCSLSMWLSVRSIYLP